MVRGKKDATGDKESEKIANPGCFQPGNKMSPGRPKGACNKVTNNLREAILTAFQNLGGEAWLKKLGEDKPKEFCSLLAKLVPPEPIQAPEDGTAIMFTGAVIPIYGGAGADEKQKKYEEYLKQVSQNETETGDELSN